MFMNQEVYHIPALLTPTIDGLDIKPDGTYVDVTFGGGGHSRAILEHLGDNGRLIAFDQDPDAIARAPHDPRLVMVRSNFRFLTNFLRYHDIDAVDGILGDLGVSFHHFDDASRGFTFRDTNSPLDMRMNTNAANTAADFVNNADAAELTRVFKLYGELNNARRIADAIVKARANAPLRTSGDLLDTVSRLLNPKQEKKDLAKIYQALRIEVNDEIAALRELLNASLRALKPGGRLAIITYHSLEDRLVKNFMKSGNIDGNIEKDIFGRSNVPLKPLTNKPIVPDDAEIEANPRSRSAKLRVATKIG
jgi:16S rRNA (cytosine1402-N4)-methyltransferase